MINSRDYNSLVQLHGKLEQWPHLKELVFLHKSDWVKDECKYGHFESIAPPSFEQQTYEGPDTDAETGTTDANVMV